MAIKRLLEVYNGIDSVSIPVKVGESILVKDIIVHKFGTACDLLKIYVDSVQVGEIYIGTIHGNPLIGTSNLYGKQTLLNYLYNKGLWRGIPVEEGQTLQVTAYNGSGVYISVIYEVHDAGDLSSTNPNGSEASERDLITYGRVGSVSSGECLYNSATYGVIVGGFPFTDKVPPAYEVHVKGVLFQDIMKISGTGANKSKSMYLKFIKEREVLYNNQLAGLPYFGDTTKTSDGTYNGTGLSVGGVYTDLNSKEPYILPEPIVNVEGQKLEIYLGVQVISGTLNITTNDTLLGLIVTQKRLR